MAFTRKNEINFYKEKQKKRRQLLREKTEKNQLLLEKIEKKEGSFY